MESQDASSAHAVFERLLIDNQLVVLDVAHNPAAAISVCDALQEHYSGHRVLAIFSALNDKDIVGIVSALAPVVSSWYCAQLPVPRAAFISSKRILYLILRAGTPKRHAWKAIA